jgi:hypothetical protein
MNEEYRCEECGKVFGSVDTLEKHSSTVHGSAANYSRVREFELPSFNRDFALGALTGILITALLVGGYSAVNNVDEAQTVGVTVVTCDNCSYQEFRETTGGLFDVSYTEVDYESQRGEELVEKYRLEYVPGFIFGEEIEEASNFTRVESTLVGFEHAYVLPAGEIEAAQRVSEGFDLK